MKLVSAGTLTYLQAGMIIKLGGVEYRVEMVNDCRARCVPLQKIKVTVKDKLRDKEVTFERSAGPVNISPNSECQILRRQA